MYFVNNSPLENYFPAQDTVLQIDKISPSLATTPQTDKYRQYFEFIPYHPVSVSSEMVGTTIEELLLHNFPTKNSWENSRLCSYPEEVIVRLDHRSEIKFVLVRAKVNRPIPEVNVYIGDGICGNFNDTKYDKAGTGYRITEEGCTIKTNGIGNFIKLVFPKGNMKTQDNPFGQVSLSQLKFFGKIVNHLIYFQNEQMDENEKKNNEVDTLLIQMGLPINDDYSLMHDQNYEIAPIDEETKITLRDLLLIRRKAEAAKDYEILRKIKEDIRKAFYYGHEILNCDREMKIATAKNDYDKCIELRKKKEDIVQRRDNIDAIYETSRYEKMIQMAPSAEDLLSDALYREKHLQELRERELRERQERERLKLEEEKRREEEERRRREEEQRRINEANKHSQQAYTKKTKFSEYVSQDNSFQKKDIVDELQYNQGDKDLEPFFVPRAKAAGGIIPSPDINKLRRAHRQGILTVTGVRLFSALIGEDWKMREAAVRAFLDYIENPLLPRYVGKTLSLFLACIEVAKYTTEDKVIQIYLEGLKILQTCLAPPICGNDIEPNVIQKAVREFLPIYLKKIAEFNDKQRDLTMKTVIDIFRHPALNVGELVKACLDIVESNQGITPDKQPWNILLARLEIILHVLDEFGIDESLWDWYNVFVELVIPSLFHQKPDCRFVAEEICVILYKFVGSEIRNIINYLQNLKPNLKEKLNSRMDEIDVQVKKESDNAGVKKAVSSAKGKGKKAGDKNLEVILEEQ
ncbi:MAG: hypothetical protein MJ252_22600 [archaeon]|nr:hypothetical protein [archaeon]